MLRTTRTDERAADRVRALVAVVSIDMLGTGLFLPVSLLYFTQVAGIALPVTGLCLSAAQLVTLPLPLIVGRLVDRYGARTVVLVGLLLQAVGFTAYLGVGSAPALCAAAGVTAVGQRAYWSSVFTLVADVASPERRDLAYARSSAAQNAGIGLGALIAALLLAWGDDAVYTVVVGLNATTFAASAVALGYAIPRRSSGHDEGPPSAGAADGADTAPNPLRNRPFVALVLVNTVFAVASGMIGLGLPVYVHAVSADDGWTVGILLGVNTAALALGQTAVARRAARRRRSRILMLAAVLWAGWGVLMASTLALPASWAIALLFPITALYTLAELLHAPTSNAVASRVGPDSARGRHLSTFQFSFAASAVAGPALFTQLFAWHPAAPWLVVGAAAGLAVPALVVLERHLPAVAVGRSAPAP